MSESKIEMKRNLTEKYALLRKMLIDERIKANLKQADVSSALGKPQSYVSKIERGERSLDIIEFMEISKVIGFDPVVFLQEFQNLIS